jgi:hypothetical protein
MMVAVMVLAQCWTAAAADKTEGQAKGRENQPPVLTVNIPLQNFMENNIGNRGYHLVNLSKYFSDDGGVENLTYSVVFATDPAHICATVDGQFLNFTAPTLDWYGQEKFRVRATDSEGLYAESNNFTVRVTPGPSEHGILPLPTVRVNWDEERFFDLTPYVTDVDSKLENMVSRTNSSFVWAKGPTLFIKYPIDEPGGDVCVTVNDSIDESHANLKVVVMPGEHRAIVNFNISMNEDGIFQEILSYLGPLNPNVVWRIDSYHAGNPPAFNASFINNDTLRVEGQLHRYGTGKINATVSVPGGNNWQYCFNVTISCLGVSHRLVQITQVNATEHQNVRFRLIKGDPWDDLVFWTYSTIFNITPDGWVNFTPDQKEVGEWRIFYTVSIDKFDTARRDFNLTVLNVNDPPENATILKPKNWDRFTAGEKITLEANATDVDGDQLYYRWFFTDGILFATGQECSISKWTVGRIYIFVNVSDGEYSIDSPEITITVMPKPDTTVEGPNYRVIGAVLLMVCILAAAMGAALYLSDRKP